MDFNKIDELIEYCDGIGMNFEDTFENYRHILSICTFPIKEKGIKNSIELKKELLIMNFNIFEEKINNRISLKPKISNDANIPNIVVLQEEYEDWDTFNAELLKNVFNLKGTEYYNAYLTTNINLCMNKPIDKKDLALTTDYINRKILNKIKALNHIVQKIKLFKDNVSEVEVEQTKNGVTKNDSQIFIVHGHNEEIKEKVARTIEKLELEPIILREKTGNGNTIIEKFEKFSNVDYAIIILTEDDKGGTKIDDTLNVRARQNVIFEMGYFIGKKGRESLFLLGHKNVELPSDIAGFEIIEIDSNNAWRYKLASALKDFGYEIDLNKLRGF